MLYLMHLLTALLMHTKKKKKVLKVESRVVPQQAKPMKYVHTSKWIMTTRERLRL